MEMERLFVQKGSKCRIVAIACSAVGLATGAFTLFAAVLAAVAGLLADSDAIGEWKAAFVITMAVSLLLTAQTAYSFYGTLMSHKTLKHIGWAWVAYPVLNALSGLAMTYLNYAEALGMSGDIMQDADVFGIVSNSLVRLAGLAIGIVLLMYSEGKLSDKRILLCLSGGVYLFSVTAGAVQYISFYTQTGNFPIMMAIAAVTSIITILGSNFITYGVPFFLALSMKNTSDQHTGENYALS